MCYYQILKLTNFSGNHIPRPGSTVQQWQDNSGCPCGSKEIENLHTPTYLSISSKSSCQSICCLMQTCVCHESLDFPQAKILCVTAHKKACSLKSTLHAISWQSVEPPSSHSRWWALQFTLVSEVHGLPFHLQKCPSVTWHWWHENTNITMNYLLP